MTSASITLNVTADRRLLAEASSHGGSSEGRIRLAGLDQQLVRHFSRWLTLHDRPWDKDEIRAFGRLLHRCMFPLRDDEVWPWLRRRINDAGGSGGLRLILQFPAGDAELTAIPWEYLHTPDSQAPEAFFLARHPSIVLSRRVPAGMRSVRRPPLETMSVLPVVANPHPERLGNVDPERVLQDLAGLSQSPGFEVLSAVQDATADSLARAVADQRPDLVHFMGHGTFDEGSGTGRVALHSTRADQKIDWVDAARFADLICGQIRVGGVYPSRVAVESEPVRVVLLHTCESGRADFSIRFAGLAPELLRRGVQCVIAMQYPITNEHASLFSSALYEQLGKGTQLDIAVQWARDLLVRQLPEHPRLIGVPMLYQQNADAVLRTAPGQGER